MVRTSVGDRIVGSWALLSAAAAVAVLAHHTGDITNHLAAWRGAVVPLMLVSVQGWAAWRILKGIDERLLLRSSFALQLFALSVGPIGYRLTIGPYIAVGKGVPGDWTIGDGFAADFVLLLGDDNRMPEGLAMNVVALVALVATNWPRRESNSRPG